MTGELSNDGKPLRRFMQTFVLAPQSANKYYVHNDIFRYQDEVFSESDDEGVEAYEPESAPSAPRQHHVISGTSASHSRIVQVLVTVWAK